MRPISYEVDGFPEFIRSENAARRAIERGLITPDTQVIAYGDNGDRERMRAADHPLLATLLAPATPPVEAKPEVEPVVDAPPEAAPPEVPEPAPVPPPPAPTPEPPRRQPVPPVSEIEPQPVQVEPGPPGVSLWWIAAGIVVILFVIWVSSGPDTSAPSTAIADDNATAEVEASPTPEASPETVVTLYATREIAVRAQPSASSAQLVLLPRATAFTGVLVPSTSGAQYQWLRITEGPHTGSFVSAANLFEDAPPEIDTSAAGDAYLTQDYVALSRPDTEAPARTEAAWRLRNGQQVTLVGTVQPDVFGPVWAEIMLPRMAGVGYVPLDMLNRTPPESGETDAVQTGDGGTTTPDPQPEVGASYTLRLISSCSKPIGLLLRYRTDRGMQLRAFSLRYRGASIATSDRLVSRDIYFAFYEIDGEPVSDEGTVSVTYRGEAYQLRPMQSQASGDRLTASFSCNE